ncbi:hypothetical protein [Massilia rhizosphaerae]|uniref:hypothetical protein n=1 Tax=Massilia rhizosphaerae TaxID=2784389 RepID=UPI0018DD2533|nr:hypothetical protein [Massilia rhizosphaerae]
MNTSEKELQLRSWNRFITRNFEIEPELIGKFHKFQFANATVTIRLPKKSQVDRPSRFDQIASRSAYRVIEGIEVPLYYHVHKVDVEVNLGAVATLNPAVLTQHCNAYELVTPDVQEQLNSYCVNHQVLAAQAFEYWLSVLRWTSDNYSIGRYEVTENNSGWSTYLHDVASNRKIWIGTTVIKVPGSKPFSIENWRKSALRLRKGAKAEPYITILHEAEEYLDRGEYRRSLIDMAVATELYIRRIVMSRLPETLNSYLIDKIERVGISEFSEKIFPESLNEIGLNKLDNIKKDLKALFTTRNQVMHMADYNVATEELCKKFLNATKALLGLSEFIKPMKNKP